MGFRQTKMLLNPFNTIREFRMMRAHGIQNVAEQFAKFFLRLVQFSVDGVNLRTESLVDGIHLRAELFVDHVNLGSQGYVLFLYNRSELLKLFFSKHQNSIKYLTI